jgi:predicted DNA-binding transcriptional regulator AlpA
MKEYLETKELAERLHIKATTLVKWRHDLEGPPWARFGKRHIRYPIAGVENWLASNLYGEEQGAIRLIMSEEEEQHDL